MELTSTSSSVIANVTSAPASNHYPDEALSYILVPVVTLLLVVAFAVVILLLIQRKRRLDRLRHRLMPFYNFAPGEEEDWETELLEGEGDYSAMKDYKSCSPAITPRSLNSDNI